MTASPKKPLKPPQLYILLALAEAAARERGNRNILNAREGYTPRQ